MNQTLCRATLDYLVARPITAESLPKCILARVDGSTPLEVEKVINHLVTKGWLTKHKGLIGIPMDKVTQVRGWLEVEETLIED